MTGNAVTPPTATPVTELVGAAAITGDALLAGFLSSTNINVTASSGTQTTAVNAGGAAGEATIAAGQRAKFAARDRLLGVWAQ